MNYKEFFDSIPESDLKTIIHEVEHGNDHQGSKLFSYAKTWTDHYPNDTVYSTMSALTKSAYRYFALKFLNHKEL